MTFPPPKSVSPSIAELLRQHKRVDAERQRFIGHMFDLLDKKQVTLQTARSEILGLFNDSMDRR